MNEQLYVVFKDIRGVRDVNSFTYDDIDVLWLGMKDVSKETFKFVWEISPFDVAVFRSLTEARKAAKMFGGDVMPATREMRDARLLARYLESHPPPSVLP